MSYKRISPMPVIEGGTNATSFTVTDGVVYYNGTRLVTVAATGTAGTVLTSGGVGVAPSFQAAGGGPVSSAQVVLTSAQVKALHATPIQIVAAPGAGSWINVFQVSAKLTYGGTTPFVAAAAQKLSLFYNNGAGQEIDPTVMPNATITATSNQISNIFGIDNFNVAATAVENKAVVVLNPVATEITGDAANDSTITVNVLYQTLTM